MKSVYALLDQDDAIRYIGCTGLDIGERSRLHWCAKNKKTSPVAVWLRTLNGPPATYLFQRVNDLTGFSAEAYWINLLKQIPGVNLLNVVDNPDFRLPAYIRRGPACGERNSNAVLTVDDVLAIRDEPDDLSLGYLARKYGVSVLTVHNVRKRKTWKHV